MTIRAFPQFPQIVEGYPLDLFKNGWWEVIVPALKTNLCRAPSFERGKTASESYASAWQIGSNLTGTAVATTQTHGARSLQLFVDDPLLEGGASTQVTVVAGTRYTFSLNVRREESDHEFQIRIASGTSATPSIASSASWKQIIPTTVWKRFALSFVAPTSGTYSFAIVKTFGGTDLASFYIDSVQVEVGSQTEYFDGDTRPLIVSRPESDLHQPQFYWTGEPHASASVRTQYTRASGERVKLSDYGWLTKGIVGLGTPPFLPIGTPYAIAGGSEFNRVLPQERTFSLVGRVCADSYHNLSRNRQEIQSLVAPVILSRTQPILLSYQPTDECGDPIGCPIIVESVYTDGFTGNTTNRFQEEVSLNFKSFNPFVRTNTQQGAELTRSRSFPFVATRFATGKWTDVVYDSGINSFGIGDIHWGLDGAIYMAQYTSNTNLALKRLAVGATSWTTLENITVGSASIKNVRMTFARDWKLWITGINFFPADATKRIGYYDLRNGTFTWTTPASIGGYGVDIAGDYRGGVYVVTQPTAGTVSRVYRYDTYSSPSGWKLFGETDDFIWGVDVARNGQVYIVGEFTQIENFDTTPVTGIGGTATTNGDVSYVWAGLGEGITGTGAVAYDVAVAPDGNVYIAGDFDGGDTIPETYSENLIKWNGTSWESVVSENGMDGAVRRLYIAPDNTLYIFGTMTTVEGVDVDYSGVYRRGRWQPLSRNGSYSGVANGSPVMMGINPQSGDFVLARNIINSPILPAYSNVYADMTAWSRPVIRIMGEGTLFSIVNHTSQSDIYFGGGFFVYDGETITIDLSTLRPKITSDVRGDISQFVSPDSRLGSWRMMPGANEIETLYETSSGSPGGGGRAYIYWDIQHLTIDAAINCNFDTIPIPPFIRADDEVVPDDFMDVETSLDEDCYTIWWDGIEGAEYYEIEYSVDGIEWNFLSVTEDNEYLFCPDDPLGVDPFFRVRPVFEDGAGEWTEVQYGVETFYLLSGMDYLTDEDGDIITVEGA